MISFGCIADATMVTLTTLGATVAHIKIGGLTVFPTTIHCKYPINMDNRSFTVYTILISDKNSYTHTKQISTKYDTVLNSKNRSIIKQKYFQTIHNTITNTKYSDTQPHN